MNIPTRQPPIGNGLYGNSGSGAFVVGPDKTP